MKRFVVCAGIALVLSLFCASQAEARIFEPQPDWWNAGRTCIDTRTPPGLAWDGLPARACVARIDAVLRKPKSEMLGKAEDYSLARQDEALSAKLTDKTERA